jgi:hypothetical protein
VGRAAIGDAKLATDHVCFLRYRVEASDVDHFDDFHDVVDLDKRDSER